MVFLCCFQKCNEFFFLSNSGILKHWRIIEVKVVDGLDEKLLSKLYYQNNPKLNYFYYVLTCINNKC